MKDYHLNTHPDFVKINELAHWGENHSDPWVRRLAEIVADLNYILPLNNDVQSAIDEYTEEIDSLNNTIRDLEFDLEEAASERNAAREERDALKFDLDKTQHEWLTSCLMTSLKARVVNQDKDLANLRSNYNRLSENYQELSQKYDELSEKYNTWKIISS